MLTEESPIINNTNCTTHMPCIKFCVAASITLGSFVFGCSMIATAGVTSPLLPFYTGLITSSIAYWCPSPSPYPNSNNPGKGFFFEDHFFLSKLTQNTLFLCI